MLTPANVNKALEIIFSEILSNFDEENIFKIITMATKNVRSPNSARNIIGKTAHPSSKKSIKFILLKPVLFEKKK